MTKSPFLKAQKTTSTSFVRLFLVGSILLSPNLAFAKPMPISKIETVQETSFYERAAQGPYSEMGSWQQIAIPVEADRMQGVHTLLLPNGKVLLANGSSNRNQLVDGQIQNGVNIRNYSVINNVGLFDPALASETNSGFTRIPAPLVPQDPTQSNDLFCSGQLHLPDGNVLFAGGTQSYYGQEQFQGSPAMQVYDWQTNAWSDVGPGKDGHWYPSVIPLENGQLMVISGLSSKSKISPWLEFYDSSKSGKSAWKAVDISKLENSPWNTYIIIDGKKTRLLDGLQMYPRIYPLPNDKFLLTHDGVGWDSASGSETSQTYIMSVTFSGDQPQVSFEPGPTRKDINRVYGTAVQEPITGDILLFAGQEGEKAFNNNDFGPGPWGFSDNTPKPVTVTPSFSPRRSTSALGLEPTMEKCTSGNSARMRGRISATKCWQPSTSG
ncbi:MAG: hypothetical protein COA42_19510 [Alteromonadaceae bacterium]|nr:MAG: hypothetical protein COA42_19510 [Alteromonadaceae bacterium]